MRLRYWATTMVAIGLAAGTLKAAEPTAEEVRSSVHRALTPIRTSMQKYAENRDCFSCHHQAAPLFTLALARGRGFEVKDAEIREQVELTKADLESALEAYQKGRGQGGGVTRAGYALATLATGDVHADEVTTAVAGYLLNNSKDSDHWTGLGGKRPPSEGSEFTATYFALRALQVYGTADQRVRITERSEKSRDWLKKAEGVDTEDRVFRLRALRLAAGDDATIRAAAAQLQSTQRADGGWAQLDGGESDAYATGSALAALHEAAGLPTDDAAYRRGVSFLINSQGTDGTWHVKTRSSPVQRYFESGFPHGKDQFISISASAWAASALLLALPKEDDGKAATDNLP